MTPISTGYQPEFGLGALYQGFNAANADKLNEEEILKAFLQNQKDKREAPLNQIMKQWEAKQAEGKMNDPEYLAKMIEGYKGQMNSQIAAGNKGMRTWESDAAATNADNANKTQRASLLTQFMNDQLGQNYEAPTPLEGTNGQMGFNFGSASNALKNPNLTEQQRQLIMQDAMKRGENPLQNFSKVQDALVNTPEHLQKMEQLNTKGDYSLEGIRLRNEAMLANAKSRASQIVKDPKYTDIVAKAILIDADPDATPEEKAKAARIIQLYTRIEVVKRSAGQVPGLNLAGTQETGKPVMGTTPAREFMENPEMLTGDSTRRKEAQAQRGVATGQVSSGNKFKVERTD